MRLRPAAGADRELLWAWANDPVARAASFRSNTIAWDEHVAWFAARMRDAGSRIYVVEESEERVGVVRLELDGSDNAVISINIAPAARGRGIGPKALQDACDRAFDELGVSSVTAYIKPDNTASVRAFEQAGFVQAGSTTVEGAAAVVMESFREERKSRP